MINVPSQFQSTTYSYRHVTGHSDVEVTVGTLMLVALTHSDGHGLHQTMQASVKAASRTCGKGDDLLAGCSFQVQIDAGVAPTVRLWSTSPTRKTLVGIVQLLVLNRNSS